MLETLIPSIVNFASSAMTGAWNQSNYEDAQNAANAFALRSQREAQRYNSLENQFAQMARVGMNPNLLTGQAFEATSPVQNQSVAPPVLTPPQMPAETFSQTASNRAGAENQHENAVTTKELRAGLIRQQGLEANFTIAQTKNAEAELPVIQKQLDMLETQRQSLIQSMIESDSRVMNVRENTFQMRQQRDFWRKRAEREIDEIISRTALNYAQREYLLANKEYILDLAEGVRFQNDITKRSSDYIVKFNKRRADIGSMQVLLMHDQHKTLKFNFGLMDTYSDLERKLGIATSALQVADQLIQIHPATQVKNDFFRLFGSDSPHMFNNSPSVGSPYDGSNFYSAPTYSY